MSLYHIKLYPELNIQIKILKLVIKSVPFCSVFASLLLYLALAIIKLTAFPQSSPKGSSGYRIPPTPQIITKLWTAWKPLRTMTPTTISSAFSTLATPKLIEKLASNPRINYLNNNHLSKSLCGTSCGKYFYLCFNIFIDCLITNSIKHSEGNNPWILHFLFRGTKLMTIFLNFHAEEQRSATRILHSFFWVTWFIPILKFLPTSYAVTVACFSVVVPSIHSKVSGINSSLLLDPT